MGKKKKVKKKKVTRNVWGDRFCVFITARPHFITPLSRSVRVGRTYVQDYLHTDVVEIHTKYNILVYKSTLTNMILLIRLGIPFIQIYLQLLIEKQGQKHTIQTFLTVFLALLHTPAFRHSHVYTCVHISLKVCRQDVPKVQREKSLAGGEGHRYFSR